MSPPALTVTAALAACLCALSTPAVGAENMLASAQLAGQKLDSGLGSLPHYRQWADPSGKQMQPTPAAAESKLAGEKIDSGLGELPHYRHWADPSGRQVLPARAAADRADVQLSQAR